jgi:hypothetical protein
LLVELGRRTALAGDNYFRAKAYLRAADMLSALVEPLDPDVGIIAIQYARFRLTFGRAA